MQEAWHPSLRVIDIIERSETFILPLLEKSYQKPSTTCLILYLFDKVTSSIAVKMLIILIAIFIRIICNLMYYETAFRSHYNTITHTMNNNVVGWYKQGDEHEFQSYPPLYGYLYCLIGSIQKLFLEAPIQELGNSGLRISANSEYDYRTNNYIWIIVLTLLEAATFYSGVYMWIKSFYRKLTNQVKHSIIFLALICPVYLIANVLAIRFNSIMIGLMIWAVYFWINSKAKLCVFCTALAIHIEPKAFIFVIPMMIYTIKVNVVTNVVNNHAEQTEMKHLIKEITDKTFSILGSYIVLFAVVGLIWLPWILIEDFNGMVNVIYSVYLPESDFTFLIFKSLMFLMIMIYNLRALVIKTSKKVILITLFNLSVGYCICFTMNADSISLIITWGFLACYELREISFMIIVSWLYSIYILM